MSDIIVPHVSFSQFATYESCPFQWYMIYHDKLSDPSDNIHSIFGSAMHDTLQHYLYFYYMNTNKEANKLELYDFLAERMSFHYLRAKDAGVVEIANNMEMESFFVDGMKIIDYFIKNTAKYFPKKYGELIGCEVPLEIKIRKNLNFVARLDVVVKDTKNKKIKITDFKKSYYAWRPSQKKDETKRAQLQLYKYFYSEEYLIPIDDVDVEFLILKQKLYENIDFTQTRIQRIIPPNSNRTIKSTVKRFNEFVDTVFDINGNIISDIEYKKNPNPKSCKYCSFVNKPEICERSRRSSKKILI